MAGVTRMTWNHFRIMICRYFMCTCCAHGAVGCLRSVYDHLSVRNEPCFCRRYFNLAEFAMRLCFRTCRWLSAILQVTLALSHRCTRVITHATVHINDFWRVRATTHLYAQVKGRVTETYRSWMKPLWHSFITVYVRICIILATTWYNHTDHFAAIMLKQ